MLVLALFSLHPPDGRGEDGERGGWGAAAPDAPPPPGAPRPAAPASFQPAPDPATVPDLPAPPDPPGATLGRPRPAPISFDRARPPIADDPDVSWNPRKAPAPPPPKRLDAPAAADDPPTLPPPKPAPPDGDRDVLLGAARNAVKQHNWDQAIARFQEYFNRYGDDFDVRKEYAGVLVQAGRLREALAEFQRLAARKPGDRDLLVSLADAAVQAREYRTAIAALVRALQAAPGDREVAVRLARAYGFDDDFAYALKVYDEYLAGVRPEDERAPRGLAALLIDLGRPGDALPFLTARLERQPGEAETLAVLVQAYAALDDRTRAEEALKALADRAPRAVGVRQDLGDALYAAEHYELAGEVYAQVLQAEPANGFALLGLARVAMKQFQPGQALQTLDRVPREPAYERSAALARAEYHQLVGEYLDAKEIYQDFLRRNEEDFEVRLSLAELYEFIREDEKAKAEYLKIPPGARPARLARVGVASTLTTQRRFPDAVMWCKQLLAEKPDDGAATAQLVRTLGKACQGRDAEAQARGFLRDFARNEPACLSVRLALAKVLCDDRKFQDAVHEYEALLADPAGRIPESYYGMARALDGIGDPEKAHQVLGQILSLTSADARNRLLLADLFSGDFDDGPAVEMAQTVLKFEPDNLAALIRLADAEGRIDRQTGQVGDAVQTARAVLGLSPSNVRGRLALARALATGQDFGPSSAAYEPLIAADPDFLVPRREQARVFYSGNRRDAGADAYIRMATPCADERLHADMAALAQRDARSGLALGPCLAAGLPGDVLLAEASKAAAALGDAECQAALQRLLLDYRARQTEQEGSRLEGEVKDGLWRQYEIIPVAKSLIELEPSNTSALFDLGQDFSTLRLTHDAIDQYARDVTIDPSEYEAATALGRAGLELRPQAAAGIDFFLQHGRDGLAQIQRTYYRTQVRLPFGDEDEFFSLGFARANYAPTNDPTLAGNILSAGWQEKFGCEGRLLAYGQANLEQYPDRISTRVTFDAGARYAFCDLVAGRAGLFLDNVVENGESIRQDIYRYGGCVGADFQPARIWTFGATGTLYHYSDDNDALELFLKNGVELLPPPCQLKVVLTTDLLGYRDQTVFHGEPPDFLFGTIHPYFAPSFYGYYEARLEWKHWISRDYFAHSNQCWYSLQYGVGWDNEFNNYHTVRALGNFDVRPWLTLSADAQVILSPVYQAAQATAYATIRFP